jgi:putative nucleotidyltransferase with HDIG domain
MQILANQTSTFLQVAEMYEGAGELFLDAIRALAAAIDAKDPYTQGHSQRVSDYSVLISRELGLDDAQINDIRIASLLHDIGKIGIPDAILLKGGSLTPEEYDGIKRHPSTGVNILSQVRLLEPVLPGIAEHHERLNGSGYPSHKAGTQISLMGRIVAVADVFDAMTSGRPYRPALSAAAVLAYLEENAGVLFDAACVQALKNVLQRASSPVRE